MKTILETKRLRLRELDAEIDAAFILALLNTPKFIKFIGDRGIRTVEESRAVISERYQESYAINGYGLYAVDHLATGQPIGICGFVRRDTLPGPDIGFAFLPEFERQGYGFESATATIEFGLTKLGFREIFAITSVDNEASISLLEKLGFSDRGLTESGADTVKLFCLQAT